MVLHVVLCIYLQSFPLPTPSVHNHPQFGIRFYTEPYDQIFCEQVASATLINILPTSSGRQVAKQRISKRESNSISVFLKKKRKKKKEKKSINRSMNFMNTLDLLKRIKQKYHACKYDLILHGLIASVSHIGCLCCDVM